jgi:hypothetical protein
MNVVDAPSRAVPADAVPRGPMPGDTIPRLCGTVEGVEFWISRPDGTPLRCVVTAPALRQHFGAEDDTPAAWMAAFFLHRRAVEARALAASRRRDDVRVVLVTDDEGELRAAAGRCGG